MRRRRRSIRLASGRRRRSGSDAGAPMSFRHPVLLALAAALIAAIGAGWVVAASASRRTAWEVSSLEGAPTIGSRQIGEDGRLPVGEWLQTGADARARISVGERRPGRRRPAEPPPPLECTRGELPAAAHARDDARDHLGASRPVLRRHSLVDGHRSRLCLYAARRGRWRGDRGGDVGMGRIRMEREGVVHPRGRDVRDASGHRAGHAALRDVSPAFEAALTTVRLRRRPPGR